MLKILNLIKQTNCASKGCLSIIQKRTFLSQAYYCNEVWEHRLNNPALSKINLDDFYQQLDQKYQKSGQISAVDVDFFANAIKENDDYLDELLDLIHKLRLSAETSNTLTSTPHATIRYLLNGNHKNELLNALDDRLNYGLFLDYYEANLLMDKFYKEKDFTSGARVAGQLMLQDETDHNLSNALALLHCFNFLLNPIGWPQRSKPEEPEEEVKIRVKYIRNPYFDDHFDLEDPLKIVGKTLIALTKQCRNSIEKSFQILGAGLYEKHEKAKELIKKFESDKLCKEILDLLPENNPTKEEIKNLQFESVDVNKFLENLVKKAEKELAEKDVALQCEKFRLWDEERREALERQVERLSKVERLTNIESIQKDLKTKEEKLWFFENEEQIELDIDAKRIYYPKKWFGKKKKPRKIDEGYIPPEV